MQVNILTMTDENTLLDVLETSTSYERANAHGTPVGSRVEARHRRAETGCRHDAVAHRTWART
ncbi:hypothetical protein ACERII_08840 [Evansella sp. AB-rgal1]|uniref:hypothetical protein n=1 Tax=Evansella sp. AB-rgal1 TaxID=3242696 RepID=UPI00359D2D36